MTEHQELVVEVAELLQLAKDAHSEFERLNGPHPDWPEWYAEYMVTEAERRRAVEVMIPNDLHQQV